MKKRFVAFLLVLIMVLGMLPVSAMASFDEPETTSVDKVDAVPTDDQTTAAVDMPSVQAGRGAYDSFWVKPYDGTNQGANNAQLYNQTGVDSPGQGSQRATLPVGATSWDFFAMPKYPSYNGTTTIINYPRCYYYRIETDQIIDPNNIILKDQITVGAGRFPNGYGNDSGVQCAVTNIPVSDSASGTAAVPVTLYFYYYHLQMWRKCTFTYYVTSKNGGNVPTIPVEWDREHELYVPVGYEGSIDFAQKLNGYYLDLYDLEVISEDTTVATITGALTDDETTASVTIKGLKKDVTTVYATYSYSYSDLSYTYYYTDTEKINVHVIDPYALAVEEGDFEDYTHQLPGVSASRIRFNADTNAPVILSGDKNFSIGYCTDYDTGESLNKYIADITDTTVTPNVRSGGVAFRVTGKEVGSGVIKASFAYNDNNGGLHAYVDVINVTVTEKQDPQPDIPPLPDKNDKDITRTTVNIQCVQPTSVVKHNDDNSMAMSLGDYPSAYTLGTTVEQETVNGETRYYVTCTIDNVAPYISAFNTLVKSDHSETTERESVVTTKLWYHPENKESGGKLWIADPTLTIYVKCNPTSDIPDPKDNEFDEQTIKIVCDTKNEHSENLRYSAGTYTIEHTPGARQCTVRFNVSSYLSKYFTDYRDHREAEGKNNNVYTTFSYGEKNGVKGWYHDDIPLPEIHVVCDTTTKPRKPAMSDFANDVLVHCENSSNEHADTSYQDLYFGTTDSTRYTEVKVNGENVWQDEADGKWTYQIELKKDKYIEAFNTNPNIKTTHTDTNPEEETYVTWKYDGRQWNLVTVSGYRTVGAVINVTCEPKAPTAVELKELEMAVRVECDVDASQRHTDAYGLLGECDKDYFVGEPRKDGDDWLCDISYDPDRYVAAFNTTFPNPKHVQNDEKIVPVTLIWAEGSWQPKTQGLVRVTEEYTVTYTDGVENEVVFADQVYTVKEGDATPTFNGTPTRTGYTFAGWDPEVAETVTETVTYVAKWTPVEPTRDDIFKALKGLVTVTCINRVWYNDDGKLMDCGQTQYGAMAGIVGQEYTLVKGDDDTTWVVTFPVTNFVKSFKRDPAHNLYSKDTLSWFIRWEDNTWKSEPVELGVDDVVKLTHAPTNWREVAKIATGGKDDCIHVSCVNGETGVCDYGITVPFVYSATDVVSVKPDEDVPGCYIATFKVNRYIDTCAKACNDKNFPDAPRTHKRLTPETVQWRLYATDKADEKIGNEVLNHVWAADPVKLGTDDVCTIAHNWVVTFDPNNSGDTFTQNVEYEGKATAPVAPEKTGYTFDGWYLGKAEEPFDFDNTTITSDITLTAKWEAKKADVHLVIFKSGDLSTPIVNVPYTTDKLAGDTIDLAEIDPSSYLDFDFEIDGGWYNDGLFNLYKKYVNGEQANKPVALTELQINGNWQNLKLIVTELVPVVYFKSAEALAEYQNDHSKVENIIFTTKARVGSALPTTDAPTATREGYTFTFWSREGQTVDVTNQTVNGWTNLYANWEANSYTVTFDANGGTGTMADQEFTYDAEQALTANAFSRTGYTFKEWTTNADGTGTAYADKASVKNLAASGSVTLYAQWTANKYTVTFDANGGTGTMTDQEFTYDVEQALTANAFSRTGYTFKEWTTNADGTGTVYADKASVKNLAASGSVTLYAQWTANKYTVTFDANGGTGTMTDQEFTYDVEQALTKNAFTKTGHTFKNWKDTKNDGKFYTDGESVKNLTDEANGTVTLVAQWTPNTYNYEIHYFKQQVDGSYIEVEVDKSNSGTFGTEVSVIPDADKYGSHFSVNETKSKLKGTVTVAPEDILKLEVYYARDRHTLTYLDSKGGSVIGTTTELCGVSVAAPKDPTKAGYWFDGWYNAADNKKVTFPVTLTNDMTVYAGWTMIVLPGTITKKTPKLNTADHFAYVQGYPDGTVKPAGNITRAETAAILFRLMDDSSRNTYYSTRSGFRDVSLGTWYNTYVATLNNAGVITDSANGYFRPNDAITRAELAAMLAAFTDTTRAANYFNDVSAKYWASNAIAICAKLGWINGYPDGSFRPDKNVTRAELMAMINRATGRAPKSADAFLSGMKTWKDNTADKWYYLDVQEATNSHSYTVRNSEVWTALNAAPNWSKYE